LLQHAATLYKKPPQNAARRECDTSFDGGGGGSLPLSISTFNFAVVEQERHTHTHSHKAVRARLKKRHFFLRSRPAVKNCGTFQTCGLSVGKRSFFVQRPSSDADCAVKRIIVCVIFEQRGARTLKYQSPPQHLVRKHKHATQPTHTLTLRRIYKEKKTTSPRIDICIHKKEQQKKLLLSWTRAKFTLSQIVYF